MWLQWWLRFYLTTRQTMRHQPEFFYETSTDAVSLKMNHNVEKSKMNTKQYLLTTYC